MGAWLVSVSGRGRRVWTVGHSNRHGVKCIVVYVGYVYCCVLMCSAYDYTCPFDFQESSIEANWYRKRCLLEILIGV